MKLYEITEQHKELEKLAETSDEDMAQALVDTFEAIEGDFQDKALALVTVANNIKSDSDAIDAEIKRLQARKKTMDNRQNSMKEYLRTNMEACGISNIKCPLFSITLGKPRKMVLVTDEGKIPTDYIDYRTSAVPMKAELLKALKNGDSIPGVELGESKASLIIK